MLAGLPGLPGPPERCLLVEMPRERARLAVNAQALNYNLQTRERGDAGLEQTVADIVTAVRGATTSRTCPSFVEAPAARSVP